MYHYSIDAPISKESATQYAELWKAGFVTFESFRSHRGCQKGERFLSVEFFWNVIGVLCMLALPATS